MKRFWKVVINVTHVCSRQRRKEFKQLPRALALSGMLLPCSMQVCEGALHRDVADGAQRPAQPARRGRAVDGRALRVVRRAHDGVQDPVRGALLHPLLHPLAHGARSRLPARLGIMHDTSLPQPGRLKVRCRLLALMHGTARQYFQPCLIQVRVGCYFQNCHSASELSCKSGRAGHAITRLTASPLDMGKRL